MTRLEERLQMAAQALRTLEEVTVHATPTTLVRDAALQRFEYTPEAIVEGCSVHTYNEELARAVYRRVREYVPLLRRWLRALEQRAS